MRLNFVRLLLACALLGFAFAGAAPSVTADHCDPRQNPDCRHENPPPPEQGERKDACHWTRIGAPATVATFGGSPGSQLLTLSCPHHIFVKAEWGYKNCRFPLGTQECTKDEPIVHDLGEQKNENSRCSWDRSWAIYAPNINVFTFWFKATTYKDENCDGKPDDWNSEILDPLSKNRCYWQNYFGPKANANPTGTYYPYTAAPYGPLPDLMITYCDLQIYETQWRGWN